MIPNLWRNGSKGQEDVNVESVTDEHPYSIFALSPRRIREKPGNINRRLNSQMTR
jgi:hypothetical protein